MAITILPCAANWGPEANIIRSLTRPVSVIAEPAGRAYQARLFPKAAAKANNSSGDDSTAASNSKELEALRVKLCRPDMDLEDYYALLGLEKENVYASEKQIKEIWKKITHLCHPDKASPDTRDFAEKRYKAQQKAYATLSVNQTRRGYDSTLPFDEKIPKGSAGKGKDFFKVYGPVFERNARFSEVRPVPLLGDKDTPYEEVDKFYDFWLQLKSWRDFTYLDEHHPDDMTDRFEKREMERKNKKLRAGKKKEETVRIRTLTEDAMKKDPRVIAHKQAIIDAKEFAKSEKKRLAQKKIDDEAKAVADAAALAAEEAKKAQAQKKYLQEQVKQQKKMRTKLRRVAASQRAGVQDEDDVELLCAGLDIRQLAELCKFFGAAGDLETPLPDDEKEAALALFAKRLAEVKGKAEEEKAEKQRQLDEAKSKREAEAAAAEFWSEEELAALDKAFRKFKGAYDMWGKIHAELEVINPKRALKEVVKKAKAIGF